jgi:arylsulfatase A-like enzyme
MLLGVASLVVSLNGNNSTCTNLAEGECWYNPGSHVVDEFPCGAGQTGEQCAAFCCAKCDEVAGCLAFTANFGQGTCFLKDGQQIQRNKGNCTSGGVIVPPSPTPAPAPLPPAPEGALNVLLILIDDLRPELGLYGSHVPTPHLDAFARGPGVTVFSNAYVQYSFCCPSRNSFMSGRRPSKTKTWNFIDDFRHAPAVAGGGPTSDPQGAGANWTTMPQWFKQHGYFAHALGKIFHPGNPADFDPPSWSDPGCVADNAGKLPCLPPHSLPLLPPPPPPPPPQQPQQQQDYECLSGEKGGSYCELPDGMAGPDDALADNAVKSVAILANWSAAQTAAAAAAGGGGGGHPFFLGVGFHKPHIPWTIPTRWFAPLASIADTALPKHERPPVGMPPIAWNKGLGTHALDSYTDADRSPAHAFSNGSWVAFPFNLTKAMRRGYYAAVSYTDHNIGRVLDALAASPAAANTVVAIMGDHGYNLGELNLWCKMTVFESGTRVPLLFRVPPSVSTKPPAHTTALAEAVDLFPTLVEVAGRAAAAPDYCDGTSLAPVLLDAGASVKEAAYSEFVKCYSCCRVPDAQACMVGPPGQPGGTQGRCPPSSAAGLADLHEMSDCFKVPRATITRSLLTSAYSLFYLLTSPPTLLVSLSLLYRCRVPPSTSSDTPCARRAGATPSGWASTARCCTATSTASWAPSCTTMRATTARTTSGTTSRTRTWPPTPPTRAWWWHTASCSSRASHRLHPSCCLCYYVLHQLRTE